jgi:DNA-binding GntR family transcriptional regulator
VIFPGQPRITGYKSLAIHLRREIADGRYRPGQRLPSEDDLRETYGLAIGTVNRAVHELRRMGIVDYIRGYGVVVREPREIEQVYAEPGSRITSRPATTEEVEEWGEGVAALILWHEDGTGDPYPSDRTEFYT